MDDQPLANQQPQHIVALDTYGVEKVFVPVTRQRVSAIKCTRAVPAIFKLLFSDHAVDVSPGRASYTYIQLTIDYQLKNGYLVLKLTDEELVQVEGVTRLEPIGPWVYLWRDGHWVEFPCKTHEEYRLASATSSLSYPRFSGSTTPALIPSVRVVATDAKGMTDSHSSGVTLERSGDWWWIAGATYPHKEILKAAGARWSKKRQVWYYIGEKLPQPIQALAEPSTPATELTVPVSELSNADDTPVSQDEAAAEQHESGSKLLESELHTEMTGTPPVVNSLPPKPSETASVSMDTNWTHLPQSYVGRVNVVGDCYCFGLVVDRRPPTYKAVPIYISVAGPATSVEALWAKLSQGKQATVVPDDRSAPVYLEPNKAGLYTRCQKRIDALGIDHLILIHEDLAAPNYRPEPDVTAETYVLRLSQEQQRAKLGEHVRKLIKVAVFERWFGYLYEEGVRRGLIRDCKGYGLEAISIKLDAAKWTALITEGLAHGIIHLP